MGSLLEELRKLTIIPLAGWLLGNVEHILVVKETYTTRPVT